MGPDRTVRVDVAAGERYDDSKNAPDHERRDEVLKPTQAKTKISGGPISLCKKEGQDYEGRQQTYSDNDWHGAFVGKPENPHDPKGGNIATHEQSQHHAQNCE